MAPVERFNGKTMQRKDFFIIGVGRGGGWRGDVVEVFGTQNENREPLI